MKNNNTETKDFLERFYSFYDSIIREIEVHFRSKLEPTRARIFISSRDKEATSEKNWVNVVIEISEVSDFAFVENSKESYQVLSNGLHILNDHEFIMIDFGYHIETPENYDEFRQSKFFIVGKEMTWSVMDYKE